MDAQFCLGLGIRGQRHTGPFGEEFQVVQRLARQAVGRGCSDGEYHSDQQHGHGQSRRQLDRSYYRHPLLSWFCVSGPQVGRLGQVSLPARQ
jgi:hypothetical protein